MSDTPISPTVGSATLGGVSPALLGGLPRAPIGGALGLAGASPTLSGTSAIAARDSQPLGWSALGANAAGASVGPTAWRQARLTTGGQFGSAAVIIQGSPDGLNWTNLAAVNSTTAPGAALPLAGAPPRGGVVVTPLSGGAVVSQTEDYRYLYLRVVTVGGDGSTSVNVTGNLSAAGCC